VRTRCARTAGNWPALSGPHNTAKRADLHEGDGVTANNTRQQDEEAFTPRVSSVRVRPGPHLKSPGQKRFLPDLTRRICLLGLLRDPLPARNLAREPRPEPIPAPTNVRRRRNPRTHHQNPESAPFKTNFAIGFSSSVIPACIVPPNRTPLRRTTPTRNDTDPNRQAGCSDVFNGPGPPERTGRTRPSVAFEDQRHTRLLGAGRPGVGGSRSGGHAEQLR
jgi:hypothetical protein